MKIQLRFLVSVGMSAQSKVYTLEGDLIPADDKRQLSDHDLAGMLFATEFAVNANPTPGAPYVRLHISTPPA